MDRNLAVTGRSDADGWIAVQRCKLLNITRRGCICEKCEVFLQDMAKEAPLWIAALREGWRRSLLLSKDARDGIFAEAEAEVRR